MRNGGEVGRGLRSGLWFCWRGRVGSEGEEGVVTRAVTRQGPGTPLLGAPGWSLGADDKGTQLPWCLILAWNLY